MFLESDVLSQFKCDQCGRVTMEFGTPVCCSVCGGLLVSDNRITPPVMTSFGMNGNVYDSLESIKDDVDVEVERVEVNKDLVTAEKLRRGINVTGE